MLYSFGQANGWQTSNIPAYWDQDPVTAMLLFSMIATVLIFAGSMVLLIAAAVLYVPLLCYIQGNLKVSLLRGSASWRLRRGWTDLRRSMYVTKSTSACRNWSRRNNDFEHSAPQLWRRSSRAMAVCGTRRANLSMLSCSRLCQRSSWTRRI